LANPARMGLDVVRGHVGPEIGARAKGIARARQDRHVDIGVITEVPPDPAELLMHRGVDRVLGIWSIQTHERHPVSLFVENHLDHLTPPRNTRPPSTQSTPNRLTGWAEHMWRPLDKASASASACDQASHPRHGEVRVIAGRIARDLRHGARTSDATAGGISG